MKPFIRLLLLSGVAFAAMTQELPIALHQLVVVNPAGDAVIRLSGYDYEGNPLTYRILTVPKTGKLFQLSQVFSAYGYEPKAGVQIIDGDTEVTGSNNRVYYKRPSPDIAANRLWDTFTFVVSTDKTSYVGTVTIVPPSGNIVGSNFLMSNEEWTIVGNKAASYQATFEPYSRGPYLNQYIMGTEDKINVNKAGDVDSSLWYFNAPSKFLGNKGISYGGNLQFTLSSFSGDFSKTNGDVHLVELECKDCNGPVGKGILLAFPISASIRQFKGETTTIVVPLQESKGWLKDPQNTLKSWQPPSQCDLIQVLSRLSSIRILGDWTTWYETVALDEVTISNNKGALPLCSQIRPDASLCSCGGGLPG